VNLKADTAIVLGDHAMQSRKRELHLARVLSPGPSQTLALLPVYVRDAFARCYLVKFSISLIVFLFLSWVVYCLIP